MERDATPNEPQGLQAMTTLSLGQAAKLAGVGKTTISRAITAGRLSAMRKDDGGYAIDPAELGRVYELDAARLERTPEPDNDDGHDDGHAERGETLAERIERESEIRILTAQIEALRELIAGEKARREAAEADRDRWAQQAERVAGLLPPPSPVTPSAPPVRQGFLASLFSRRAA